MSLDVYNLTPKELKHLNSSLSNYKSNCLMKLYNLQRVNHNLIIENNKLRQSIKYGNKSYTQSTHSTHSTNPTHSTKSTSSTQNIEIVVETVENCVLISFRCVLTPSEVSDYYNCDFDQLQYRIILTEWHNDILQNSSTLTTKHHQITLKSLTVGWKYMITVHLEGNNKTLSTQTEFTYNNKPNNTTNTSEKSVNSCNQVNSVTPSERVVLSVREYRLNIGIDEEEYLTCKFTETDAVEEVVDNFLKENKLKSFLKDSLIQTINTLKSSNDSIQTIDITDLI